MTFSTPALWLRYNTTPVLIKTFVETPRHTGAVFKASGWIHIGITRGRGRYDRQRQYEKPRKDIWLQPLRRDWKRALNRKIDRIGQARLGLTGTLTLN